MNENPVVAFKNVSKVFELHPNFQSVFWANLPLFNRLRRSSSELLQKKIALNDVSFSIQPGEKVGVIGRNGSGKTTLLRLVIEQTHHSSGHIIRNGVSQALMQTGFGFNPELSGIENIRNSLLYNGLDPSEHQFFIDDIIDFVELGDFIKYPIKTYSLGMHARLEFGTATAIRPDILVVDEVMGAGDGYFARKSAARMRDLVEKSTLILVSHSLQQVNEFCDRVMWLNDGVLMADGPAREVIGQYEDFMAEYNTQRDMTVSQKSLGSDETDDPFVNTDGIVEKFRAQIRNEPLRDDITLIPERSSTTAYAVCSVGDPLTLNLTVTLPEDTALTTQVRVWGYSATGSYMFRADSPVQNLTGVGPHRVILQTAQLTAGIGEYLLFFGLTQIDEAGVETVLAVSETDLKLRVPPTNYSDPPLVHLEGTWQHADNASEAARISAVV